MEYNIVFFLTRLKFRRRHILPGSCPPSTFCAKELNYCVRNGNRCDLFAIITEWACRSTILRFLFAAEVLLHFAIFIYTLSIYPPLSLQQYRLSISFYQILLLIQTCFICIFLFVPLSLQGLRLTNYTTTPTFKTLLILCLVFQYRYSFPHLKTEREISDKRYLELFTRS